MNPSEEPSANLGVPRSACALGTARRVSNGSRAWLIAGLAAILAPNLGCRATHETHSNGCANCAISTDRPEAVTGAGRTVDAIPRSKEARRLARQLEKAGSDECVDRYYEATVFAYARLMATTSPTAADSLAVELYNESLADCLRTAENYGRLDARSQLLVNGPYGAITVPVVHRGFVWSPADFVELRHPESARENPSQSKSHVRAGIGAAEVVVRPTPKDGPAAERFFPESSYFPATAVLRPALGPWLEGLDAPGGSGVLELHDPLRVTQVDFGGTKFDLAGDLDAPVALAEAAVDSRRYTLAGFLNPASELEKARLTLLEPYQAGKVMAIFVHGLLDNPFIFTDMINSLRTRPGFLNRYQIATFRYPTGNTFLRTGAILRSKLGEAETTFDPGHGDPGFQNMVLVGYSMGGLLSKLQITSSGDALWDLVFTRPLESMVAPESTKEILRKVFFFEPQPFVRRVIFVATPHHGSGLATNLLGRTASRLVRRPSDAVEIHDQIERDNPGALRPFAKKLPSSIDVLAVRSPLLDVMGKLPFNPATPYHVVAGTGYLPPAIARGDGVVPLSSAHVDGAASEVLVPAVHTDIYRRPATIDEVDRILQLHLAETAALAKSTNARATR